jgi:hypothetical protein
MRQDSSGPVKLASQLRSVRTYGMIHTDICNGSVNATGTLGRSRLGRSPAMLLTLMLTEQVFSHKMALY